MTTLLIESIKDKGTEDPVILVGARNSIFAPGTKSATSDPVFEIKTIEPALL